ncbi:MAG: GreA/GreB family elongation factor [Chloroflexi bacterium]|nr:GreA/GreB family elongation factor [Chloroflexota bacterium]
MEGTTTPSGGEGTAPARVPLTRAGAERLREQATRLKTLERPALLSRAQRASLFLSPSTGQAVAQVARNDLVVINRRIAELEELLAGADVIDPDPEPSVVEVGTRVSVRSSDGTGDTFTIVGPTEADLSQGRIASDSPAGRALLGKRPGMTVTVGSGDDALTMEIVSIGTPAVGTDVPPPPVRS